MNDFTVILDRDLSIPLSVLVLEALKELIVKTKKDQYRICWRIDHLVVDNMKTKESFYPVNKDNQFLVRHRSPPGQPGPTTYSLHRKEGLLL